MSSEINQTIPRATGLLVIEVRNSNPNGDPDKESDPRQRSHDQRGFISGVSFKRKLRDLVEWKSAPVWQKLSKDLGLTEENFCILESRDRGFKDVKDATEAWQKVLQLIAKEPEGKAVNNKYWDARLFGATFLESGEEAPAGGKRGKGNDRKHIRTGVAHFPIGLSICPIRIQRDTRTKKASAQEEKDRGMAPLGYRIVEHGVYSMPFFINPTAAHETGCTTQDVDLMLRLIRYAYPHTRSDIRPFVEVRHAWYAEHTDSLGSFSEFRFIDTMTPKRKQNPEQPSSDKLPFEDQYDVPKTQPEGLRMKNFRDLTESLPDWCSKTS
ncbi:CRISPR-associated protein [bacterium]|nr:MAG: CRISPR-associated protein [bacterium]